MLAELMVRVGADIKDLEKGLSTVSRRVEDAGKSMTQMGKTISTRVTAPLTALGAVAVRAFGQQEKAELTLRAALQANGREVEKLFGRYNAFAKEMQRVSVVGDETTLAMLSQAESFGLTADSAERAVRNSIAMQSAFGVNAQSALRYTAALEEGNATMLTRYIPSLREISDEAERVAEAQRILGNAFSAAEAEAQGSTGQMIQMKNAVGDLMEVVGEVISDAILPFVRRIKELAVSAQNLNPDVIKLGVGIAGVTAAIGPALIALGMMTRALAAVLSPIMLKIAALGALGLAITYAVRNYEALKQVIPGLSAIVDQATRSLEFQFNVLRSIAGALSSVASVFRGTSDDVEDFKDALPDESDAVKFESIGEFFKGTFSDLAGMVKGLTEDLTGLDLSMPFVTATPVVRGATEAVRGFTEGIEMAELSAKSLTENTIPEIEAVSVAVSDVTESVTQAERSFIGFEMMAGQAIDRLLFGAEQLQDVLKSIARQLASRAVMTALKMMTGTSGISGVGGFFKSVIGVNDALITSGGDVVKFHPDDNILAMKDFSNLQGGGGGTVVFEIGYDKLIGVLRRGEASTRRVTG